MTEKICLLYKRRCNTQSSLQFTVTKFFSALGQPTFQVSNDLLMIMSVFNVFTVRKYKFFHIFFGGAMHIFFCAWISFLFLFIESFFTGVIFTSSWIEIVRILKKFIRNLSYRRNLGNYDIISICNENRYLQEQLFFTAEKAVSKLQWKPFAFILFYEVILGGKDETKIIKIITSFRLNLFIFKFLLFCFLSLKENTSGARKTHYESSFLFWDNQTFNCSDI